MDRSFVQRNEESRARLRAGVATLRDDELQRPLDGGWTVAAGLAHLAFWDRLVEARWDQYDRDGAIARTPEGQIELINVAALPLWLALPPQRCVELALAAAEAVDRRIAGLTDDAVAYALAGDRLVLLERLLRS